MAHFYPTAQTRRQPARPPDICIEVESPSHTRIERWGRIIGEAGQRKLSIEEFEYLQHIVIADKRFVSPGCRVEDGFIGDHDRDGRRDKGESAVYSPAGPDCLHSLFWKEKRKSA